MEPNYDWEQLYREVVLEADPDVLSVRIYNAERKMESRVCSMDIGEAETDEIFRMLRGLAILRRERCRSGFGNN
jgi:hypothetical protein